MNQHLLQECLLSLWPGGNYVDLSQFGYDISHAVKVVCCIFFLIYCIVSKPFCLLFKKPIIDLDLLYIITNRRSFTCTRNKVSSCCAECL